MKVRIIAECSTVAALICAKSVSAGEKSPLRKTEAYFLLKTSTACFVPVHLSGIYCIC